MEKTYPQSLREDIQILKVKIELNIKLTLNTVSKIKDNKYMSIITDHLGVHKGSTGRQGDEQLMKLRMEKTGEVA